MYERANAFLRRGLVFSSNKIDNSAQQNLEFQLRQGAVPISATIRTTHKQFEKTDSPFFVLVRIRHAYLGAAVYYFMVSSLGEAVEQNSVNRALFERGRLVADQCSLETQFQLGTLFRDNVVPPQLFSQDYGAGLVHCCPVLQI